MRSWIQLDHAGVKFIELGAALTSDTVGGARRGGDEPTLVSPDRREFGSALAIDTQFALSDPVLLRGAHGDASPSIPDSDRIFPISPISPFGAAGAGVDRARSSAGGRCLIQLPKPIEFSIGILFAP
jgi:hypothetical protein